MNDLHHISQALNESVGRLNYFLSGGAAAAIGIAIAAERQEAFTTNHYLWILAITLWSASILAGIANRELTHRALVQNHIMLTAPQEYTQIHPEWSGYEGLMKMRFKQEVEKSISKATDRKSVV